MILEIMCAPLFLMVRAIIGGLSFVTYLPDSLVDTLTLLIKGMQFFPFDVWVLCLGCIVSWAWIHFSFALVNFLLQLIPFTNIGVK